MSKKHRELVEDARVELKMKTPAEVAAAVIAWDQVFKELGGIGTMQDLDKPLEAAIGLRFRESFEEAMEFARLVTESPQVGARYTAALALEPWLWTEETAVRYFFEVVFAESSDDEALETIRATFPGLWQHYAPRALAQKLGFTEQLEKWFPVAEYPGYYYI